MNKSIKKYILTFIMIIITCIGLLPFIWLILGCFKTNREIFFIQNFWPENGFTFQYFKMLENEYFDFKVIYWNSFKVATIHAFFVLLITAPAGYIYAKFNFYGKRIFLFFALFVLLIPKQALIIPYVESLSNLNLMDSHWGLILPSIANVLGFLFFIQIFKGIPNDLLETARLEGANEIGVFMQILPLVKAPLWTFALLDFVLTWNEHLFPLIVIQSQQKRTLPIALAALTDSSLSQPMAVLMAGSLLAMIPAILLFACSYKTMRSALKDLIS